MIYKQYEISLWTYKDKFVTTLLSSDSPKLGDGYEPQWVGNINGEMQLNFVIPIKYYDPDTNQLVNNEKWYTEIKQRGSLANEKPVKLIFNKLERDSSGYIHEIHEFIIESITEERNDTELVCRIECVGAAFKELGKVGTELALSLENTILDPDSATITPTIDYWLEQIFPAPLVGDVQNQWGYVIEMAGNAGLLSTKIYESNSIEDWQVVGSALEPVYSVAPIEKARFIDVKDSNRYNITQDLAETFQVFVKYRYLYESADEPFRATKKQVVYYDKIVSPTEYSISYGNNEQGLTRTSSSVDVTTKMFVEPIESELSDDGFVTLTKARNNKTKDDFILNFDYFIQSKQMSSPQIAAIPIFEKELRDINITLETNLIKKLQLDYDKMMLDADIGNLTNKRDSTEDVLASIEEKLDGLNTALVTDLVEDKKVLNSAKVVGDKIISTPRRSGVQASSIVVALTSGTTIARAQYELSYDQYGYATQIIFKPTSGVVDRTLLSLTYKYDVLSFYRNEHATYTTMRNSINDLLARKSAMLLTTDASIENLETTLKANRATKKDLITRFNNKMAPFLKEGKWSDSAYKPSFKKEFLPTIPLVYDPHALNGELVSKYKQGVIDKYYPYIKPSLPSLSAVPIEQIIVVEKFTSGGIDVIRELRYGAQWTPQFVYEKAVSTTEYATVAALQAANPSDGEAYYIKNIGKVYYKVGSSWNEMPVEKALVFDKSVELGNAGHKFYMQGVELNAALKKVDAPFTIAHRRWFLSEDGLPLGTAYRDFQTNDMQLKRSDISLIEFEDYNVTHNDIIKSITLKITSNASFFAEEFNARFKLDVSSDQLYLDALEVSKTSAFPDVSYEVSFSYLNDLESVHYTDFNSGKILRIGDIVRITDYDLQILGLKGLVSSIDIRLDRPEETVFTIQNYKTKFEDLFGRIVASTEQMKTSGYLYERAAGAFGPNFTLNSGLLQRSLDEGHLTFTSGMKNGVSFGEHGILAETLSPYPSGVKGQTLITGGSILLSDSVTGDGNRIWSTAISPLGISANAIRVGRLDVGLVNIYSGDQLRFAWKAEGMFAYRADINGATMYNTYVKYNEDGLLFQDAGFRALELGWDGLYIGSQQGSVELTGSGGLEIYNAASPRKLLIKLGGFGTKDPLTGVFEDYGMKFYKNIGGIQTETLVSTNNGELWLRDSLLVGDGSGNESYVGISGVGELNENNDPIRIWAGHPTPESASFYVTQSGSLFATRANITGTIYAEQGYIGNWIINRSDAEYGALTNLIGTVGLSSFGTTFWSGGIRPPEVYNASKTYDVGTVVSYNGIYYRNIAISSNVVPTNTSYWDVVDQSLATFRVTDGILHASGANISGHIVATSGEFSGTITANNGKIGSWNIETDRLVDDDGTVGMSAERTGASFWAGGPRDSAKFYVLPSGYLSAQNADISGIIYAERGYIAGTMAIGTGTPWDKTIGYLKDDVVLYQGYTYKAVEPSTNKLPTDPSYWNNIYPYSYISGSASADFSLKIGEKFTVDSSGKIDASDGVFTGKITADEGSIGGWLIESLELKSKSGTVFLDSDSLKTIRVMKDEDDVFYVTNEGYLYAENATIKGHVIAKTGYIDGLFTIGPSDYSYLAPIGSADYALKIGNYFTVDHTGLLTSTNAVLSGFISAETGYLGGVTGWTIEPQLIYANNYRAGLYAGAEDYKVVEGASGVPVRLWVGDLISTLVPDNGVLPYNNNTLYTIGAEVSYENEAYTALIETVGVLPTTPTNWKRIKSKRRVDTEETPFLVSDSGRLYANRAQVRGDIVAESGYIKSHFRVGDADNGIMLKVVRDPITDNFISSYIGTSQSASGAIGYGWMIKDDGSATFDNINVRGRIRSTVFEYDRISAVGGSLYIAPTIYCLQPSAPILDSIITTDDGDMPAFSIDIPNDAGVSASANNTYYMAGRNWAIGDNIIYEFSVVINESLREFTNLSGYISDLSSDTITLKIRQSEFDEADRGFLEGSVVNPGALIVFYGSAENKQAIYLTALASEGGPFIDIVDNSLEIDPTNVPKPKVRLGRLDGVEDDNFPEISLGGYGLYSQNAYLRGQLMLPGAGITNQGNFTFSYTQGMARDAVDISLLTPEELDSPIRLWAGLPENSKLITNARFIVTENGFLYASAGVFSGVVNATDGVFSGVIKAAGLVLDGKIAHQYPSLPVWSEINNHPNNTHFYVAYKKNPTSMNDYVLDIGQGGISIWEGGLRAYSDWETGWRANDIDAPTAPHLLPYGYHITDSSEPYPYFSLVDGENARTTTRYAHLVEIIQNGVSSHDYYSIYNQKGKLYFGSGHSTLHNPTYYDLEQEIYLGNRHYIGISDNFEQANLLLINTANGGLAINSDITSAPTYIGVPVDNIGDGSTPDGTLNVQGVVNVFHPDAGGKGIISLGSAQIQQAKNNVGTTIGINIVV